MRLAVSTVLIAIVVFGCVSAPPVRRAEGYTPSMGEKAAATAETMVGRPYKFKGDTPEGFDCSGLVRYSYLSAGLDLPHGTASLRQMTHDIPARELRSGDLIFFSQLGKKYSHVGIYVGSRRFVHAPSSGKFVRIDSLDDAYWKEHFLGARRF